MAYRITEWRRRDRAPIANFSSVQKIMEDVHPAALKTLEARGCDPHYLWSFLSCAEVDWPENASPNLVPKGVSAETEEAMAKVMQGCLVRLQADGIVPTKGLLERGIDRIRTWSGDSR
ncbi:hypothetical protein [Azorhizobium oxalatiphilum]|nr:hypothetical protein [Azorhizobium oxalatiphilum]